MHCERESLLLLSLIGMGLLLSQYFEIFRFNLSLKVEVRATMYTSLDPLNQSIKIQNKYIISHSLCF